MPGDTTEWHMDVWKCKEGETDNGEVGWTKCMWVNKADARATGDVRRGGWIVGDVKCEEVR